MNNGVIKRVDRSTAVVNIGNRAGNSGAESEIYTGLERGIAIENKEKRGELKRAVGSEGGSSPETVSEATIEEGGDGVGNGVVIGSKLKRDSEVKPYWGVGNGDAMQRRSSTGVSKSLEGAAERSGVSVSNQIK